MTVTTPLDDDLDIAVMEEEPVKWSLKACSSWLAGQEFVIRSKTNAAVIKVGRGSHCDIIFPGTHLSREHIELRIEGEHVHVKDLNSINGTYINEVRITEGRLRPGDKLRLDVYSFTVEGPKIEAANDVVPRDDANATKLRQAHRAPPIIKHDLPEKQWITKSTSPGNRIEENTEAKRSLLPLWIIAGSLFTAVALLGVYLFIS